MNPKRAQAAKGEAQPRSDNESALQVVRVRGCGGPCCHPGSCWSQGSALSYVTCPVAAHGGPRAEVGPLRPEKLSASGPGSCVGAKPLSSQSGCDEVADSIRGPILGVPEQGALGAGRGPQTHSATWKLLGGLHSVAKWTRSPFRTLCMIQRLRQTQLPGLGAAARVEGHREPWTWAWWPPLHRDSSASLSEGEGPEDEETPSPRTSKMKWKGGCDPLHPYEGQLCQAAQQGSMESDRRPQILYNLKISIQPQGSSESNPARVYRLSIVRVMLPAAAAPPLVPLLQGLQKAS
ncbi:uncharacterized protein LOC119880301 [Canis lupus familiaris]|uniref:uncharacterized protein LOC119880301 n=1 Tax=Canis lupus familiaris TaxID=9615 RepID=UPI0018F36637|nr:uncharacterized protein LOC119880301 [Canis lupus familiaris]